MKKTKTEFSKMRSIMAKLDNMLEEQKKATKKKKEDK